MFWGYWCIDCMFWGYWCYQGAEHHTFLWEKWVFQPRKRCSPTNPPIKVALQEKTLQIQPLLQATCPTSARSSGLRRDKGPEWLHNFHSLEVVDRVSETQLQVDENSDWIIWRVKGWSAELFLYTPWRPNSFFTLKSSQMSSFEYLCYVFTTTINIVILSMRDRLHTSESVVYSRQILTYKAGPRTERVRADASVITKYKHYFLSILQYTIYLTYSLAIILRNQVK